MTRLLSAGILNLTAVANAHAAQSAVQLTGRGDQVYACTNSSDAGYAWRLKAPDAVLMDAAGRVVGHHFAGPTWQADDGSAIVGEVVATSAAPSPGAIPWLVLRAKSHSGSGLFSKVSYVVRSGTEGGMPPSSGCSADHAGAEIRVRYSATYTFFPG